MNAVLYLSMEHQINRSWAENIAHGLYYGFIKVGTPAYISLVLSATSCGDSWDEVEAKILEHVKFLVHSHTTRASGRYENREFEVLWSGM